jgi:hypothetical protein
MNENIQGSSKKNISVSDIGQLLALCVPVLYVMGRQYDIGYYSSLECIWATQLISFQETIAHSFLPIFATTFGIVFGLTLALDKIKPRVMQKNFAIGFAALLLLFILARLFIERRYAVATLVILGLYPLMGFGLHIAYVFLKFTNEPYERRMDSMKLLPATIAIAMAFNFHLGSYVGLNDLVNLGRAFPEIKEMNSLSNTNQTYLISYIGGKFLILNNHNNEMQYRLENDLTNYNISAAYY